jgi:UDP-glucose 4-epimerase
MISDRSILVTGGGGFIGSHLAERLVADNDVTVLDDFSTGRREHLDFLPDDAVIDGSILDTDTVESAVEGTDVVVHMAAMMGVQRTLDNPREVLEINIDGARTVLSAAADDGVERVLVASTSEVYGDAPTPPYCESDPTSPKTNYAVSKLVDERFAEAFAEEGAFDYTAVRYFNVYGPRQDASAKGYVVPLFLRRALAGKPIEVHGEGDQTRDFTYINDAVDCTLRALGGAGRNETFNVGTGLETTVRELSERVQEIVPGTTIEYIEHPRPYTIRRRCANVSKAEELLGYEPEYSLREGLEETRAYLEGADIE